MEKISERLNMNDITSGGLIVGGSGLQFAPETIISVVGMVLTAAGILMMYLRVQESGKHRAEQKRSNDIAEKRLNFDMEKNNGNPINAET